MTGMRIDTPFARKLSAFVNLSAAELDAVAELHADPVVVEKGTQLVDEGQTGQKAFVLNSGWACCYKDLANGNRQIISFPVAGDCFGLRGVLLRTADHSVVTLTSGVACAIASAELTRIITDFPRLGAAFFWAASRDESLVVEHLVSIGRRTALERTAHFFLELEECLRVVGLVKDHTFQCPLTQFVLADALGLTAIHVNRVLRQLREEKLLTLRQNEVTIHNGERLREISGFRGL